jgi:hypothetical protein
MLSFPEVDLRKVGERVTNFGPFLGKDIGA